MNIKLLSILLICSALFTSCIEAPDKVNNVPAKKVNQAPAKSVNTPNAGQQQTLASGQQGSAVCHINKISNVAVGDSKSLSVSSIKGKLFVTGWASDSQMRTPEKVSVMLNGVEKTIAKIGDESQAQAPKYLADKLNLKQKIGYSKWFPIDRGSYTLSIRVHERGGKTYDCAQRIKISVS